MRGYPFIEIFQPTYEEAMAELGYYHFVIPNGLIDLGKHHQRLLTTQREQQLAFMCPLVELHIIFYEIFLTTTKQNKTKSEQAYRCQFLKNNNKIKHMGMYQQNSTQQDNKLFF